MILSPISHYERFVLHFLDQALPIIGSGTYFSKAQQRRKLKIYGSLR